MLSDGAVWAGTCETDPQRTAAAACSTAAALRLGGRRPAARPARRHRSSTSCTSAASPATRRAASSHPGTFRGLVEKIPYLKWLGVTAVELLPIHEFDECDCPFVNPETGEKLTELLGLQHDRLRRAEGGLRRQRRASTARLHEFRDMVKAFHAAGIEVILDVVFNHTGEGDDRGRTYSLPRAGQRALLPARRGRPVPELLRLRQHGELQPPGRPRPDHDVPALLGRRHARGRVPLRPGVRSSAATAAGTCWSSRRSSRAIAEDGVLADTKLIAEPWDAAGLYQVGRFPFGRRWSEWNGQLPRRRAPVLARRRRAPSAGWRRGSAAAPTCTSGAAGCRGTRSTSSPATTGSRCATWSATTTSTTRPTARSNRDGWNDNYSWNCGVEGETNDPEVLALRSRQAKNLMATLMLSQGVPMILAGRRVPAHAAGEQQRLVPGQRDVAGWTGRWRRRTRTSCGSSAR